MNRTEFDAQVRRLVGNELASFAADTVGNSGVVDCLVVAEDGSLSVETRQYSNLNGKCLWCEIDAKEIADEADGDKERWLGFMEDAVIFWRDEEAYDAYQKAVTQ